MGEQIGKSTLDINVSGKAICEVMLRSYRNIETMCKSLEAQTLKVALHSINMDIYDAIRKIEQLNIEMRAYYEVQEIVEKAVKESKELKACYCNGKSIAEIAKAEKISESKVQHNIEKQREKFCREILSKYSVADLVKIISPSKWLIGMHTRLIKQSENDKKVQKGYMTFEQFTKQG